MNHAEKLLYPSTIVSVGDIESFKAADNCKVDMNGPLRIWSIGEYFQKHFGCKVEDAAQAAELKVYELMHSSRDSAFITELGDGLELTLGQLFALLGKQGRGEQGPLAVDGWANLAYIRDDEGALCPVSAEWNVIGWYVGAGALEFSGWWSPGYKLVSG